MEDIKERKQNLITVRLTGEETNALESLSEYMGKTKSDVITRACMYFLNSSGDISSTASIDEKKSRKTIRVHARMSNSDMERIKNRGLETGDSVSQVIRKAIKSLADATGRPY